VRFSEFEWSIFGRTTLARLEVAEAADVVCSLRIVLLYAMHEYRSGVTPTEEEAMLESIAALD